MCIRGHPHIPIPMACQHRLLTLSVKKGGLESWQEARCKRFKPCPVFLWISFDIFRGVDLADREHRRRWEIL